MSRPRLDPRDLLAEMIALDGATVVDVGCGDGALVRRLTEQGAQAIGVEVEPGTLARARAHEPAGGERYVEGAGQALPLPDASADAVLFMQSLHHVPPDQMDAALAEAARVARPGGAVYVQEPLPEGPFFALVRPVDDETRVRALAQEAIARAAAADGLELERELRFDVPVRLAGFGALRDRLVLSDPSRAARFAEREASLREAYDELAGPDGALELRSPVVAHLLRRR